MLGRNKPIGSVELGSPSRKSIAAEVLGIVLWAILNQDSRTSGRRSTESSSEGKSADKFFVKSLLEASFRD